MNAFEPKKILRDQVIRIQFLADIEFGMPSKECKNFGICRINPIPKGHLADRNGRKGGAIGIVTVFDKTYVEINFMKYTLSEIDYVKFFSTGTFLVNEDYYFSALENENYHFEVAKGRYTIREDNSLIKLTMKK